MIFVYQRWRIFLNREALFVLGMFSGRHVMALSPFVDGLMEVETAFNATVQFLSFEIQLSS